ncbi:MAG: ABC transporter permease [Acidobacteria bacterium]|nr:ABC transporter permease [Acidobacteriota bacterium]
MTFRHLVVRGLTHYWRTNAAVVAGVATAVAVLAGALLVGDSVRGSLRDLVLERLGRTDQIVAASGFFREQLAADLRGAPLVILPGIVTAQESGRRAGQVSVYGVDERFWAFHGMTVAGPAERDALLSLALATELGAIPESTLLVRVQRPSEIPLESLHGRKDDLTRTLRLAVRASVPASELGEFSLDAQQGDVRAVFVPLDELQQELEIEGRVNTILFSQSPDARPGGAVALERLVRDRATLDDLGLTLRVLEDRGLLALGADAGLLTDAQAGAATAAAEARGMKTIPVLTYLANTLRVGEREIPYSLVTAIDLATVAPAPPPRGPEPPIVLNEWAARELAARPGDTVSMEYHLWEEPGRLVTRSAHFRVAAVVPVEAGDADLAPEYPGITDSPTLVDWNPPFPIDLRRIRRVDEEYWEQYRTTPKAFIPLETGQRLWRSRYGALTSVRIAPAAGELPEEARQAYEQRLRSGLDPLETGLAVRNVRGEGLAASRGATDFGAYFLYFSFFIVVSALLLAALFFKLGVEQRGREVGLLRAVGFGSADLRRLFLSEGLVLAVTGSAVGAIGAVGYAALLMIGLRTWWVDAVGTNALALHVSPASLAVGASGGIAAAFVCVWWTLRGLGKISERTLLAGQIDNSQPLNSQLPTVGPSRFGRWRLGRWELTRWAWNVLGLALVAVLLLAASAAGLVAPGGAFFGAGALLLVAALGLFAGAFRRPARQAIGGRGWQPVSHLGLRNTTYRPGRSVLSIAVIASATFILIAVDAFRRDTGIDPGDRQSGLGGYTLLVETLLPIVHDPNSVEGRDALNLVDLESTRIEPFRLLPGDDASCLNLYEPRNPRILAPGDGFLREARFAFQSSLASTDEERANPWRLLHRRERDGAVPVIADANSMTYILHRQLGDDIVITRGDRQIRLRLVAALRDSIFQSELLMAEDRFLELFPEEEGYRFLLLETVPERAGDVAGVIESALADFGADATGTAERLARFHRVENTYLSTFRTLGGLGLLLGTIGLATVFLRNALERRRELALLGAVGYRQRHFVLMAAAENALLLGAGLATGALCAALAIAPAVAERGGRLPLTSGGALLVFAVFVTGLLSSLAATRAATRAPLLDALRSE